MSKALTTKTRPMNKGDWETIFNMVETGTPLEAILVGFPIKMHTLKTRIARDRPKLWAKIKSLPTGKHVEVDATARMQAIVKEAGKILKVDLVEAVGHDIGVLADQARAQRAAKAKDPNKVLTPVALQHARSVHALVKTVAMIPDIGLESGGGGGVTINNNVGHATVMRRGQDAGILADDGDYIEAEVTLIEGGKDT